MVEEKPIQFAPVPLPRFDPTENNLTSLRTDIHRWVTSPPLVALIELFGATMPNSDLSTTFSFLETLSAEHWDFRSGSERNMARTNEYSLRDVSVILAAAEALGMVRSLSPGKGAFDHVLILGGLLRACILRPRAAARLIREGLIIGEVSALSAFRPLLGDEIELADRAGMSAVNTELEAMDVGVRRSFDLSTHPYEAGESHAANPNESWIVRQYETLNGIAVQVVAAPSSQPEVRRANSADTFSFWASELSHIKPYEKVLLVTSTIYAPFQHCDAIRTLGLAHRLDIHTVGADPRLATEDFLQQRFTPSNYLQEVRSAIRSLKALSIAIED
jgi:hypothetical protein